MDDAAASIYLREIAAQCRYGMGAIYQLNFSLETRGKPDVSADAEHRRFLEGEIFRALHSFLSHASHLARLLWPAPGSAGDAAVARASELRSRLGLQETGHALDSALLRDYADGFDEQLDAWVAAVPEEHEAVATVGPLEEVRSADERGVLRWYDPVARRLVYLGREYELQPLATAVDELAGAVARANGDG